MRAFVVITNYKVVKADFSAQGDEATLLRQLISAIDVAGIWHNLSVVSQLSIIDNLTYLHEETTYTICDVTLNGGSPAQKTEHVAVGDAEFKSIPGESYKVDLGVKPGLENANGVCYSQEVLEKMSLNSEQVECTPGESVVNHNWDIEVTRVERKTHVFSVKAECSERAFYLVDKLVGDHDFSQHTSDACYECDIVSGPVED